MHKIIVYLACAALSVCCFAVLASAGDVAVIVNKANNQALDKSAVAKIYTGHTTSWSGGGAINALDLPEDTGVRAVFSSKVVGKSIGNLKSIWAQNIFTGKGAPPKVVDSDAEVISIVAKNKNAIGYISASNVNDSVKVVLQGK